jgi:ABC-type phosphate transport system substrate-binding protein
MNMKIRFQIAGVGALLFAGSMAAYAAGAVVVGKDSPLAAMDADQVKRVFLGRENSINGARVIVVYQKEETNRTPFETKVLGKAGPDLSAYWAKQIFTGKASAPEEVSGDAGVRAKVTSSPNAIGYVTEAGVDSTVKVIFRY